MDVFKMFLSTSLTKILDKNVKKYPPEITIIKP